MRCRYPAGVEWECPHHRVSSRLNCPCLVPLRELVSPFERVMEMNGDEDEEYERGDNGYAATVFEVEEIDGSDGSMKQKKIGMPSRKNSTLSGRGRKANSLLTKDSMTDAGIGGESWR